MILDPWEEQAMLYDVSHDLSRDVSLLTSWLCAEQHAMVRLQQGEQAPALFRHPPNEAWRTMRLNTMAANLYILHQVVLLRLSDKPVLRSDGCARKDP